MEEREVFRQNSLLKKFSTQISAAEKKKSRKLLFFVFLLTVIFIGIPILCREIPRLLVKIGEPKLAVKEKFENKQPTPTPTPRFEEQKEAIAEILEPLRGQYGIYFQDLNTSEAFEIKGSDKFSAASLMKLPVMLTAYQQEEQKAVNLNLIYRLQASDKRNGAGSLFNRPEGFEITYRKMMELMGKQSDNTAYNILSRILGKVKIQSTIDQLGMKNTLFEEGTTTPEDIAIFFDKLYKGNVVSEKNKEELLSFLTQTIWEDRIPAGLPEGMRVAHKIGTEVGVISDAGIIFAKKPFILVIMSQDANEIEAKKALPEISKKIWDLTQTEQ